MAQLAVRNDHTCTRDAIMLGDCPNRRAVERKFVRLPAWLIFHGANKQKHVAMVRDISRRGIFFYSDVHLNTGEEIEFVVQFPKWTNSAPISCKGKVVRVEQAAPGAAIGVAASLNSFTVGK
ncbi:MAG TPA: PilZ domain-containing protein [Terriglobales bacterium]|nr:PilZ domain-containing protein [Terriglobales bacterium]